MGKKRLTLIAVAVAALAVLGVVIAIFNSIGPIWKGRSLGSWLNDFSADKLEQRLQAAEAIRQIGPKAVPYLIPRLKYPSGEPVSPWSGLKTRLLYFLSRQKIIKVSLPRNYTSPRHQAFAALDALGPAAKEALPALEKLLHEHPPDPHCTYIIARIGPAGLPLLNQALTNDERIIRMEAHVCLDELNSGSRSVIFPPPGRDTNEFNLRICHFNLRMLHAAFAEYRSRHPEMDLPANIRDTPPSREPPGFKTPP
jgi:hypothetical protein